MLLYLGLIYLIFRIVQFLISHKGQNTEEIGKIIGFFILELVLAIVGIIGVAAVFSDVSGGNDALLGLFIVLGVACLIASGRVGIYVRKLSKGTTEVSNANPDAKKRFGMAKILATVSFLTLIPAWQFYQASFKSWAALIYTISLLCAILAIRSANQSRSDQYIKRISIWGLIVFGCFIAILAVFMLLGITMKV